MQSVPAESVELFSRVSRLLGGLLECVSRCRCCATKLVRFLLAVTRCHNEFRDVASAAPTATARSQQGAQKQARAANDSACITVQLLL